MASIRSLVRRLTQIVPEDSRPEVRRFQRFLSQGFVAAKRGRGPVKAERIVWLRAEVADIETVLLPRPGPSEVLIEIDYSLISSGTEKAFLAGMPNAAHTFPSGAGYSVAGRVVELGRRERVLTPGQRVAGVAPHASHAVGDSERFVAVPDGVSQLDASFVQLGAIAMHGIRQAEISPGMKVAVVGLGLIGQLTIQLARWVGGAPIVGVARSRTHEDKAVASGCDEVVALVEVPEAWREIQADVVIEASGSPHAVETACLMAKNGGRVVLLGSSRGPTAGVDFAGWLGGRGVSLVGSHISNAPRKTLGGRCWSRHDESSLFLDLIADGRVDVGHLTDRQIDPSDANAVYERLLSEEKGTMGIVFDWTRSTVRTST